MVCALSVYAGLNGRSMPAEGPVIKAQMCQGAGQPGEPAAPPPQAGSPCVALQQHAQSINGNVHHNHDALALCLVSLKVLSHSAPR